MTIIRIEHARAVIGSNGKGYCSKGMRMFAEKHNLNWEDFLLNGIESDTLAHIDDAMLHDVIAEAKKDGQE